MTTTTKAETPAGEIGCGEATSNVADHILVMASALENWGSACLEVFGLHPADAIQVARDLVQTNLWGIDSHGIARLPHYLSRLDAGSIVARAVMSFEPTGPCTGSLDGNHGLGILVCRRAMQEAIALALKNGIGLVGCRHSTHCGAIGLYGRQATDAGLVGIAFTHSDAFVAPHQGQHSFLGTNPICIAAPSSTGQAVCVDMATSSISFNKLMNARREGKSLPENCALNADGAPTTDPHSVAALKPAADHKGYALGFLIDILCGPMNGMPFGPHIPPMYRELTERRNLGSLMLAIDPKRFAGGATLAATVASMADEARRQAPITDSLPVLAPGDPEYQCEKIRLTDGIPIEPGLQKEILQWSEKLKVPSPLN